MTNYKLPITNYRTNGFTLIELVLSLAVMVIIASIGTGFYGGFVLQSSLDASASEVVAVLRENQSKSQASNDGYAWGVYFDTTNKDRYNVFIGKCNDYTTESCRVSADCTAGECTKIDKETIYLPNSIEIASAVFGSGTYTVFDRPTGEPKNGFEGSVVIRLKNGTGTKTVSVSAVGIVSEL